MRKIYILGLALAMIPSAVFAANPQNMHIYLKGNDITHEEKSKVIVKDDRICLPIRYMSESLNYKVEWNSKERLVKLKKGNTVVKMKIVRSSI